MALRVLLNDRALHQARTGVGHYIAELIRVIPAADPDIHLQCFYRQCRSLMPRRKRDNRPSGGSGHRKRPAGRAIRLWAYEKAMRLAGRLSNCRLYHEPNHIPTHWHGPVITTIHDLSVLEHPEWHPLDRVRWYDHHFQQGLDRTTHFVTVSRFTRERMITTLGLDGDRITVIPLGPRDVFRPQPADETARWLMKHDYPARYVLYVGTIEPRKNLRNALAAYALLPDALRERWPLIIVGAGGWGRETLDAMLARHDLQRRVRVPGYVDDDSLARLYAGARVLLWPVLYEGFGLPPLEAMASGTPVITSNAASIPEVVGDAGVLINPMDVGGISAALSRVLQDDCFAKSMAMAGIDRARIFSWERCGHEHAALYRRVASTSA